VAVMSRDKDVDPVGACVGMKGMRVQSIIASCAARRSTLSLTAKRPSRFAQKGAKPGEGDARTITDPENKKLEVIVEDSQLSLAIGKKGQKRTPGKQVDRAGTSTSRARKRSARKSKSR